jgi:toxin ParE1/3/4
VTRFYREAEADLEGIYRYIAADNEAAAKRTIAAILDSLRVLEAFPAAGRRRDDLFPGLRAWPTVDYTSFYFVEGGDVAIVRILGGGQNVTGSAIKGLL